MPLFAGHFDGARAEAAPGALRRPLVGVCCAAVVGLLMAHRIPLAAPLWLLVAWSLLAAAALPAAARFRTALMYALAISVAAAHGALSRAPVAPDHLVNRMRRPMEHIRLIGVVSDDPVREVGRRADTWTWRFPLDVEYDRRESEWRRARGRVEVRLDTANEALVPAYGERWRVEGVVRRGEPGVASPPALTMYIDDRAAARLAGTGGWRLRRYCLDARRWISARFARGVEDQPDAVALVRALMLGYRHELPTRVREAFAHSGALHIVAISGAHVGMMAMLLLAVVRATGLAQPRWPLVMIPLLFLYALSTGLAPSAVRACLMAGTFYAAYAVWRQPDSLSALALAALLILGAAPGHLEKTGFILSFAVVAGLILLMPPIRDWLHATVWPLPEEDARSRWLETARRAVLDLCAVTVVAWVVSAPLTAYFFNLFSPVALLVNALVMPLAFLLLFAASLSLVIGLLHPFLLELYNHAAALFARGLMETVEWSLRAPGAFAYVESPGIGMTLLLLVLTALALRGARATRVAAGCGLAIAIATLVWRAHGDRALSVAVRHLGPAAVAHIAAPGAGDWLIDTGPAFTAPRLIRFLNEQGVDRLRVVAITRGTMEAAGGLPHLLAARAVDEIWVPDTAFRSRAFDAMIKDLERGGAKIVRKSRGQRGSLGPAAFSWQALHPARGGVYPNAASGGLVLRFALGAFAVTITPGPDPRLAAQLASVAQDYGGQALIELGMREPSGEDMAPWRPDLIVRPMTPGDSRLSPTESVRARLLLIADRETVRLTARAGVFQVKGVPEIAYLDD
jgi:ComEC/Rec2-related protein